MKDEEGNLIPKMAETLKQYGVEMTDAAGQIRSTYDIFNDLGAKWKGLSTNEQLNLSEMLGGKRQANIVAATLENVDELERAFKLAGDSAGSASKEFEAYKNSLQYSLDQLRNSIQTFYTSIMNSDGLKVLVNTLTSGMDIINKFTGLVGGIPAVLSASVGAFVTFNTKARETMAMFTNSLGVIGKFNMKLKSIAEAAEVTKGGIIKDIEALKKLQTVANANGTSVKGFGVELVKLNTKLALTEAKLIAAKVASLALQAAISMGISLAITGAITLMDNFIHREEKLAEFNDDLRSSFETLGSDVENLEGLANQFTTLSEEMKNSSLSAEELSAKKNELASVTNQLIQKYPELDGLINSETASYKEQVDAIQGVIDAKKEEQALKADEYFDKNDIDGSNDIKKLLNEAKAAQEVINNSKKSIEDLVRENPQYDADSSVIKSMYEQSHENLTKYKEDLVEYKQQIRDIIAYEASLDAVGSGRFSDQEINNLKELLNSLNAYDITNKNVKNAADSAKNSIDNMSNSMGNQANKAKDATTSLQEYADSVNGTEWSKDLSPTEIYGKAISEVETLQGYINDMNSETGYTAQLVSEIAQKYPEIGARVTDAEQVQQFLNDKIAEQVDIQNQAYEIMIGNDNDYYNAKIKNNQDYQSALNEFLGLFVDNQGKAYSIDLSLYDNLNEAKSVALNKFGQGVDNFLKQFVYGNDQAYRIDVANFNNLAQAKAATISSLSAMLVKLQNQTAAAFTEQANALNEMKSLANGSWINGTGKKGTNQMNVFEGYAEKQREINALKDKIGQLQQIDSSGLSPGGYTGTSFSGTSFSPTTSGGSGGKGGSGGSSSAKEGTYLQDLYDRYSELQKAIDRCANAYDLLEEKKKNASDKDKLKYIKEQIDLINKQKDAVNALRNEQQKQYDELKGYLQGKGFNINSDGAITNYSRIKELTAWAGTNDDRKEEVEAINDAIEEFNDLVQNDMPKSRKEFESLTNTVAELNEEMKDIYKSELELVTDAQEEVVDIIKDRLDKQKELLDKEYEDRKESLEKTKKLYQDQNAEEDYAEELAEEQKKLDEMKNSLIDLQRDVSGNSDALIADMKKQIEEQEKVIRDKQKQYERDKTEQALDQAIEDIENEKDAMDKQWNEQYSEANIVQMATQALNTGLINLNGEVVSLQDAMIQFENETGQGKLYTSPYVQKCA